MLTRQMVDVWSVLPTFTAGFGVRVQVFQHVPADSAGPERILASALSGPALRQDGTPTPVLHLYWRGDHFEPLFVRQPQPEAGQFAQRPTRAPVVRRPHRGPRDGSSGPLTHRLGDTYAGLDRRARLYLDQHPGEPGAFDTLVAAAR